MKWIQRLTNFFTTSLQRKLLLVVTVVVTLVMIAFGFYLVNSQRQTASTELEARAARTADLLAQTTAPPLWNVDTVSIESQIKAVMTDPEVSRVAIYETDKSQPIVASDQGTAPVDPVTRNAEIILQRGEERISLGTVQIVYSHELLYRSLSQTQVLIGIIILALILLLIISIYFVAGRLVTNPLRELATLTSRVSAGDYTGRANLTSRDEMSVLATAFNAMTGRLREQIDSLETRVEVRTAQLQASADVGRATTSILDQDQLLKQAVNLITERFGFYYAAIFTLSEDGRYAVLREASGPGDAAWVLKQSGHKLEIGEKSMVSTAINNRQPCSALDVGVAAAHFANPLLPDTRSEIALPLIVGDQVLGALDVQSTQMAAFDEASANVLQAMAAQIAVAIINAAQYQREQARAKQTAGLLAATLELSSQPDRIKLLERIGAVTISLLKADGMGLWFPVGEDQVELRHAVNAGSTDLTGRQLNRGEGLAGKVYGSGLAVRVDDYQAWSEGTKTVDDEPFHSALGVPLLWQDHFTGVLTITRSQPDQPFTSEDESLAQLLAAQAAAALDNIRLRAEQLQALTELDALNRRLTGEAWQVQALSQVLTYEHRSTVSTTQTPGLSLHIPIELRGTPIGTITLEDERARTFTDDERALISGVTQQLALALENQRLTDVAQQAAQRDRAIAETADKIHQPTSLDAILRVAVTELSRITGISGVGVQLGFAPDQTNGHNGHQADRAQENE